MITLPVKPEAPKDMDPTEVVIFSHTKVGKTSLCEALPNHLLIDLESGSKFVTATKIDVNELATKEGVSAETILHQISTTIKNTIKEKGKSDYDFIVIDTATALEDIARKLATQMYKKTTIGKSFTGRDVVSELDRGAGYDWLRKAFETLYDMFRGCANKSLILFAHVRNASITKDGKDIQAQDIYLTGKLRNIVCKDADAIGFMHRKDNQNIISFKTNETDLATGARPPHLKNQEFVLSEMVEGNLKTYWNKIFKTL